jgi:hypothetical protein
VGGLSGDSAGRCAPAQRWSTASASASGCSANKVTGPKGGGAGLQTPKSPMPRHRGLFSRSRPNRESPPAAGSDGSYWRQTRRARRGWLRTRTGLLKRQPGDSGPPGLGPRPVAGSEPPAGAAGVTPRLASGSESKLHRGISQCPGPGPLGLPGRPTASMRRGRSATSDCDAASCRIARARPTRAIASARLEKGCVCQ